MDRMCDECGAALLFGRPRARFCDDTCRHRSWRRHQPQTEKPARSCEGCGNSLSGRRRRFCDKKCRRRIEHRRYYDPDKARQEHTGVCAVCGGPRWNNPRSGSLPDGQGRCLTCCSAARQAKEEQIKAARIKPCAWCTNIFEAKWGALYCSDDCRDEMARKHRRKRRPKSIYTTTQRGYGTEHKKARRQLLAELTPGTLCELCNEPMSPDQELDLDHSDPSSRWRGEPGDRLTHATCNRREGSRRQRHCDCEVCSGEFAMYAGQRCRRRPEPLPRPPKPEPKPKVSRIYIRDCVVCGETYVGRRQNSKTCGQHTNSEVVLHQYHSDPEYRAKAIERAKQRYRDKGSSRKPRRYLQMTGQK